MSNRRATRFSALRTARNAGIYNGIPGTAEIVAANNVTALAGWCGNAGTDAFGGNDFSFSRDADLNGAACQAGPTLGWCPLWCKDAAARCVVMVTPQLDGQPHPLFAPFSVTVPRDTDGNGVADIYEMAQVNGWNGLYANVTNVAKVWIPGCWGDATNDTELAELGLMRTDGDYSQGAPEPGPLRPPAPFRLRRPRPLRGHFIPGKCQTRAMSVKPRATIHLSCIHSLIVGPFDSWTV